jgi:Protein of unknown function (DUF1064).
MNRKLRFRTHKYGAKKTRIDGITFDSLAEANYYHELKLLQRAGIVTDFELQPKFELIPSYTHPETGRKIRATYYIADFRVTYADGRQEIIDVKGVRTEAYKLKKRLFEYKYNIPIKEVGA